MPHPGGRGILIASNEISTIAQPGEEAGGRGRWWASAKPHRVIEGKRGHVVSKQGRFGPHWALMGFGLGALLVGATAVVIALVVVGILLAPLAVWLAWNVLDFAQAIGAPELGFWGIVLLTLFLIVGFGGRVLMAIIVWIVDPQWFSGSATLHWPEWSFSTFVALVLLLLVMQISAHTRHERKAKDRRTKRAESAA